MIIECPKCNKKFNLDEKLIPENGRALKCSACDHVWYHTIDVVKNINDQKITEKNTKLDIKVSKIDKKDDHIKEKINEEDVSNKTVDDLDFETKDKEANDNNTVKLKMIFVYFIILIISLLGLIFLLDTFKYNLSHVFPDITPLLDSFYETFLDLKLFFKDLAK